MDGFQKIVLFTAIIILIIVLVLIGIALSYAKDESWPPMVSNCPDYWIIDGSGNDAKCIDIKDLADRGACPTLPLGPQGKHVQMSFDKLNTCQKYKMANQCGFTWDGITYGVNNPCVE